MAKNPKIVSLIEEAQSLDNDEIQIVRIYKDIKKLGKNDNLWSTRRIPPKRVVCHSANRGGYGVGSLRCLEVGETVDGVGHDDDACKDATCFEATPEDEEWYLKECCANDDLLPVPERWSVEGASVGCTHYNTFLGMAIDRKDV